MAERRVLALLGPCRVDGVGGGVGFEDLRGLDGVDVRALHEDVSSRALTTALELVRDDLRRASRAANDAAWAPLGLHAPEPKFACCSWWPELVLPSVEISEPDAGSNAGAKRRAEKGGAEEEKHEKKNAAPSPRSAAPDSRWLDARCADEALAAMVVSASRSTSAQLDDDAWDSMTNPAGAAARAAALLADGAADETETSQTDVAWITAGVDGGGGGAGEWPPEAVAAYGVMRAAKQAGGEATIVVLVADESRDADDDDGGGDDENENENERERERERDAPPLLLEMAARVGAAIRTVRFASNEGDKGTSATFSNGKRVGVFGDSARWRGGLTVAAAPEMTLPGLRLVGAADDDAATSTVPRGASRGAPFVTTRSASSFPRAAGDATLLEIVRLETVPADRRRDAPPLRLEWTPTNGATSRPKSATETETEKKSALGFLLRDDVFAALAAASRAVSTRGETPAFLVRVPFSRRSPSSARANISRGTVINRASHKTRAVGTPAPHADGPILLVRLDFHFRRSETETERMNVAFVADALASVPSLLLRAVAVAGASARERALAAVRDAKRREEAARDQKAVADGGGAEKRGATPASVASTGRKRARGDAGAEKARAAAAAKRRASERRRDASSSLETGGKRTETASAEVEDLDDDASRERALAHLASSRVRSLDGAAKRLLASASADAADADDDDRPRTEDADDDDTMYHRLSSGPKNTRRPLGASAFARVLSALAAAQRRRDGFSSTARDRKPLLPASEGWSPEKLRLTATLLRAAADVAAGHGVVSEARRDAGKGSGSGPEVPSPSGAADGGLAIAAPSRSPSKSGASREFGSKYVDVPAPRASGDVAVKEHDKSSHGVLDYAAAEAELRAKVQRERREKRERQRITMAPRHVPAARRTGNAVLAAATKNAAAPHKGQSALTNPRDFANKDKDATHGTHRAHNGSGGGTVSGHEPANGDERFGHTHENERGAPFGAERDPEPSESAVGAGAAAPRATRNRVCTKCHIELAPIPGVNMSLMKHCYACGGTLAPGM